MKISIEIKIYSMQRPNGLDFYKYYETNVIPRIGESITDSFFAENKKVIDIIHNLKENHVSIVLEQKEMLDHKLDGHVQEVAKIHDWLQKDK